MTQITAASVKELRDRTGAGMMDCKKALAEVAGDIEKAIDWLRKKGLSTASKKADRVTAEGLVAIAFSGNKGAILEVNAETDFVSRNEKFQAYVNHVRQLALSCEGDLEAFLNHPYQKGEKTVQAELTDLIAVIGENMQFRRLGRLEVSQGVVSGYVHNGVGEGMGRIGVIVGLESTADHEKLSELARHIAMHVAASKPASLAIEDLDKQIIEREKAIFVEQARNSGKPEAVIEKMIEGRLRKFFQEVVLLEQNFIMDTDLSVGQLIAKKEKEWGVSVRLAGYLCFALGEGIAKNADDFADEVSRLAQ